jgi:signal transduction histidine kinase
LVLIRKTDDARSRIVRSMDARKRRESYRLTVAAAPPATPALRWQGLLSLRQTDWLVFATTVGLGLPAVSHSASHGQLAISLAVLPFATVPLLWRRRYPGLVSALLVATLVVSAVVGKSVPSNVGVLFGLYAAAAYGGERLRIASGALAVCASLVTFVMMLVTDRGRLYPHVSAAVVFGSGAAWFLGEAVRTRRVYLAQLEDRATRLERERDEHVRRAAEQERIRIARELHDVVTHHVSAIAVQAGAAYSTSRSRPERALNALGLIETTARSTLGELRTLLGVLRAGEEPGALSPLRPRPSMTQLDELVTQARTAGIGVELQVRGSPVALDAVVDLTGYRIIQEALTNVVKHALGSTAIAVVSYESHELGISVIDNGPVREYEDSQGHGLIGMQERVELCRGDLTAGPIRGGGFRVEARLPLRRTADGRADDALSAQCAGDAPLVQA